MVNRPGKIVGAFFLAALLSLLDSEANSQECLSRDIAIIDAAGGYFRDLGGNVTGQAWFGSPVDSLFPVPLDLDGDGVSDVCEAEPIENVADEILPPTGTDPMGKPKIVSPLDGVTLLDPEDPLITKVYWHAVENKLFANEVGLVKVEWPSQGGSIKKTYDIQNDTPTAIFFMSDGASGDGPAVDLTDALSIPGEAATAKLRYNATIVDASDAWIEKTLEMKDEFHAAEVGTVVLEYNDLVTGVLLNYEVVEILNPFGTTRVFSSLVDVGSRLEPQLSPSCLPQDAPCNCRPLVTRGIDVGNEENTFAYQHSMDILGDGPTLWSVYAIKPTGGVAKITIYWLKEGARGVCWHNERHSYSAEWPADAQVNIRGNNPSVGEIPKVDMSAHGQAQIMHQLPPTHATIVNREFSTITEGLATVMYVDDATGGAGKEVSFEVVDTVEHNNGSRGFPIVTDWNIGDRLTDVDHDSSCNDGYLYNNQVANYDPTGVIYDRSTLTGAVFPVNVGNIEMWWYETSQEVCWPVKPALYSCVWPATPDRCIIIANQNGSGTFPPSKYLNPAIYVQENGAEYGFNPNEEHARWVTNPGDSIYAARDDLNTPINPTGDSDPYVLVSYQDREQSDAWEFDVIRVTREIQPGNPIAGCPCADDFGSDSPCTFHYLRTAGQPMQPPMPLSLELTLCPQDTIITEPTPEYIWDDDRGGLWFIRGGAGLTGTVDVIAHFYERWEAECTPWLDDGSDIPIDVKFEVGWPQTPSDPDINPPLSGPDIYTTLEAGRTRDRSGFRIAEILYNEAGAVLIMPWKPSSVDLPFSSFPDDYQTYLAKLPPHIRERLSYDEVSGQLQFKGVESLGLLGIMSENDRDTILATFSRENHAAFRAAVTALHLETQQTGAGTVGFVLEPDSTDWGIAVSSGPAQQSGWVVIGYNGRSDIAEPAVVEVLRVICPPHQGEIEIIYPDCPFDEQITLRWSGDCGGDCKDMEFYWQVAAGDNPDDYDDVDPDAPPGVRFNPWEDYVDPDRNSVSGYVQGQHEITIRGANVRTLTDNWFHVRVRGYDAVCGLVAESTWTDGQLAEGWIKRVKRGINPFDQRVQDFTNARVATYVSMIEQLGNPYRDVVAFTCDAERVNALGLIEIYEAVLFRGRSFTIDLGVQYPPADQALILMAGNLADFHMLLANEALGDAADPTIAIDVGTNEAASAMFCFQDQLPTNENSLLYEELALLRGRDDRGTTVEHFPVFNRLFWNFTLGDGQVAYVNNYNIQDKDGDGFKTDEDAAIMFPQGHGDAWGHYLTASKFYYDLLMHPNFSFPIRSEFVLVGQVPVEVSFAHERKFARVAAAKARCGIEIMDLTYREQYLDDPSAQWTGYEDSVPDRHWGVTDWAQWTFVGAHFDWLTANAILPATDDDPAHHGTVQEVHRGTVAELREIASQAAAVQTRLDTVNAGLNPLGLAKNVVPFDISPAEISNNKTHFEQIYERAVKALNNSIVVFNHANALANSLRRHQDEETEFQANIEDREADYNNRLIEVFGYPYPEDKDPVTGNIYGPDYNGPDLFHWAYIDTEELFGMELPDGDTVKLDFEVPFIDPTDGSFMFIETNPVEFNIVPGFGLIKPRQFTQPRKAPGEIQLARGELMQAKRRFDRALIEYENALRAVKDQAWLIAASHDISDREIQLINTQNEQLSTINSLIRDSRKEQLAWRTASNIASIVANAAAEMIPTAVGLSNDVGAPVRGGIRGIGAFISEGLGTNADNEAIAELGYVNSKEELKNTTQLELRVLSHESQVQIEVKKLEQQVRALKGLEVEIFTLQEATNQASGRYQAALQQGLRLLEERTRFRRLTAAKVSDHRYKDMAFRIFRNDALQKYRAQFDLAARYVYLAAKAYDFETNLLSADSQAGEAFFSGIVRERTIGQISGGLPIAGRGLADVLARLDQNFSVLKGQLGFNNPQTETNRFSLRQELFRITPGLDSNPKWQEMLELHRVDDLRVVNDFQRLCDPLRVIVNSPEVEPGIIVPMETTITIGQNFFGWPLAGGDSSYSSTNFATKVRSVGVWFSNYNNTASAGGLTQTPRVYLVPTGADVMRVPTVQIGTPREWFLVDQILPVPFPINVVDLQNNRDWLPGLDNFGGSSDYGRPRRFGDFRAYHDGGSFNEGEVISDSRLIGRSVWNTRWLLIIPGRNLMADPEEALNRFIYGNGSPGEGVTDIKIFFQTYAYTSG